MTDVQTDRRTDRQMDICDSRVAFATTGGGQDKLSSFSQHFLNNVKYVMVTDGQT